MSANNISGLYQASVANNADPLAEARVTLLIPQILGRAESAWAVPAAPTNTIPPVGQKVWVQFSGGDVTKPVYQALGIKDVQDQVDDLGGTLDGMPPKQPTGLLLSTSQYVTDDGTTQASVTARWTAPTENQDGTSLTDLSHYVVQTSYDGSSWGGGAATQDTLIVYDTLHTGADFFVRVQALDSSSNASLWTTSDIITASSSSPPPVPSTPVVLGVLGGIRVTWNGLDNTGAAMPKIVDRVQVMRDTNPAFPSPVVVATMRGADFVYDPVQNYANSYNYRLVAYSKVGTPSAPSASASGTAKQAVNTDILDGALSAAKIATGAIDDTKLADGAVKAAAIANGAVEAGKLAALAVGTVNIANNAVTGAQMADATIGTAKIINGAIGTAQIADAAINNAKIANLDAGKITTGSLDAARIATGSLDASKITAGTLTALQIMARTITGNLLQANTITANEIQANTITANQMAAGTITAQSGVIASLDASKITTGTLDTNRLTVGVQGSVAQKFYDTGSEASRWTPATGAQPTSVLVPDGQAGGSVMRVVGGANALCRSDTKVPFDPGVLYRVTAVVRQTVDNSTPGTNQGVYVGLFGWGADGTTIVNRTGANANSSHHYVAAAGNTLTTAGGWTRFTGYVRGWAAVGAQGSANPTPSPQAPGVMHANVRYVSPVVYANYSGGTGTQEFALFTIEVVETGTVGSVNIQSGAITADKLDAAAINGKVITGATVQTADTGARVVLDNSKFTAYGTGGGKIGIDPNAVNPFISLTSPDGTTQAVINVSGVSGSDANLGLNSGLFTPSGDTTAYKWRTWFGNDFWVTERVVGSTTATVGPRMFLTKNSLQISANYPTNDSRLDIGATTATLRSGGGAANISVAADEIAITAPSVRAAGVFKSDNVSKGRSTVTPIANTPTSIVLNGGTLKGTTFYGYATAETKVPGTTVTGVGVSDVSSTGMTIWVTRTNNTNTTVNWMIVGE